MCECNESSLDFYNKYHQNFWNKLIHVIFIPIIVLSIRIFLNEFYIANENIKYPGLKFPMKLYIGRLLTTIYVLYYFIYGMMPGIAMLIYFSSIEFANSYIQFNIPRKYFLASCMFVFGWTMQFIGHGIEGNRPAIIDSVSQAFLGAPLFSIQAFLPSF
jgi:uncharacterized membrane protein YGL010W